MICWSSSVAKVVVSQLAKADMREIGEYIRRELRNPSAATGLIRRFRTAIASLGDFPESGSPLLPHGKVHYPYRFLVCGNYLVFYHTDKKTVMVDRVLYGRRDYLALLFGDTLEEAE